MEMLSTGSGTNAWDALEDKIDMDVDFNDLRLWDSSNIAPDMDMDVVAGLLNLSVTDVLQQRQSPLNDIISFSRQLDTSGVRVCHSKDIEFLDNGEPLGSGASLTVFKGRLKPHGQIVAVKKLNLERATGASSLAMHEQQYRSMLGSLILELRVMMHPWFLSHPNIVNLLAVYWEDSNKHSSKLLSSVQPVMVVEIADQLYPTLQHAIQSNSLKLCESDRFRILEDVAEGMTIIHGAKMIHGDIKPENILLFRNGVKYTAKVSDFGFSNPYVEGQRSIGGTTYWNAPECLPEALAAYKPYATTITRDLYSYGLLMWFTLFLELPFGPYGSLSDQDIAIQKLSEGQGRISLRLDEKINNSKQDPATVLILEEYLPVDVQERLLWWQVWRAMSEMFRVNPKSRSIALGEMCSVFRRPVKFVLPGVELSDVFEPSRVQRKSVAYIRHGPSGIGTRPHTVSVIAKDMPSSTYASSAGYRIGNLPKETQEYIFTETFQKLQTVLQHDPEYLELLLVVASYYRVGFGVDKDLTRAFQYELEAAKLGSRAAQYASLVGNLLADFELDINDQSKTDWLLNSLVLDPFHSRKLKQQESAKDAERLLCSIPVSQLQSCLIHAFKHMHLRDFEILHGFYGQEDEDELLKIIIDGDVFRLRQKLIENRTLLQRRMNGSGLIHIAADYCQEDIIRMLVKEFQVSCNDKTDHMSTVLAVAACSGGLECCLLLLALGASPDPALSQSLFTSVAMTGCRGRKGLTDSGGPGRIRELLRTLQACASVALDARDETTIRTSSTSATVGQHLLDGTFRYQSLAPDGTPAPDENEEEQFFSPLQYALSITHYDSTMALLGLGANPNNFCDQHPPLHLAVLTQQPVLVALLLANGADPNIRDVPEYDCAVPLHVANGFQEVSFYLPPVLEIVDIWDRTSPTADAKRAEPSVMQCDQDLEHDAADRKDDQKCRMLHYGNSNNNPECVVAIIHILVSAGADINAHDSKGRTALALALEMEDTLTAATLRSLNAQG